MKKSSEVWQAIVAEARDTVAREKMLSSFFQEYILNQGSMAEALSLQLASRLSSFVMPALTLRELFQEFLNCRPDTLEMIARDIEAAVERDPGLGGSRVSVLLYCKGFHALEAWRCSHWLWESHRHEMALFLQGMISQTFHVDIHPAAVIGQGIMLDHATGIIMGETTVVGDDVSILQNVTLGCHASTCQEGVRHPRIGSGVLIGPDTSVIGNVRIGDCARICAGSVVLKDIAPHAVAAGIPARELMAQDTRVTPSREMEEGLSDECWDKC